MIPENIIAKYDLQPADANMTAHFPPNATVMEARQLPGVYFMDFGANGQPVEGNSILVYSRQNHKPVTLTTKFLTDFKFSQIEELLQVFA